MRYSRTEVVPMGLQQVGRKPLGPISIVESEGGGEAWSWNTPFNCLADSSPPSRLSVSDSITEEVVKQQVLKLRVGTVGLGNISQKDGTDDASTTPHESDSGIVQLPSVLLSSFTNQHETLSI